MIIASTNEFSELGKKIAINLNVKFSIIESKIFPDGENYIRFTDSLVDKKVIIIQSCFPEQNKKLIELFMMLDAAKNLRSKEVIAVVPYLAYSRQDKSFLDGEAISITTIVKLIETSGANAFITVDIHEKSILDFLYMNPFLIPFVNILETSFQTHNKLSNKIHILQFALQGLLSI